MIKPFDREELLSAEIKKRLTGMLTNVKLHFLHTINDTISEFVFQRYDELICGLTGEAEISENLALTA